MSVSRAVQKAYKWVVEVPYLNQFHFFKTEPKKVMGGYMVAHGKTFIGNGVTLYSRKEYEDLYGSF